ncbi:MAG: FkbM family methyltransferase [Bacteroidales bacterium]|nr:FkbM family methyltransferase [Bacteroidales bacterium]
MRIFRVILYKIFGLKVYLKIVSKLYLRYINCGFGKDKYPELHYLKSIIKPGFVCIDIGANLGYYSYFLAKITGRLGKLYAVEPVPLFAEIWKQNLKRYKSLMPVLLPFALGKTEKTVQMGMPAIDGVVHHGMTRVIDKSETGFEKTFSVEMKNPDQLFQNIEHIDFVKIDVEGFESEVFQNMKDTLQKHKPLIQAELSGSKNRETSIEILQNIGYNVFFLKQSKLISADKKAIETYNGDFYFMIEK